jgi:glycosyltransferase involved in cell wall biosynthesis
MTEQTGKKPRVAAIVPAYNEEKTIAGVLKVLLRAKELDEIIVACDGSTDETATIARQFKVRVLDSERRGKGQAMRNAVKQTNAEIIAFFDADLLGLAAEHVSQLVEPVLNGEAAMVVGIRDRWGENPLTLVKIDPLLALGGERAMKRSVFENIPERFIQGFAVETALNYYCQQNKLPVRYVKLKGLDIVMKEKKVGFFKGFWERIEMHWHIRKMRFLMKQHKEEFKKA